MSIALATEVSAPLAGAEVALERVGVRFDFDRRSRVVTPVLAHVRRIRTIAWGLRGVDLRLEPGAGLALVGPTGSGKTTLLRILAGVLPADEGSVAVRGRVGSLLATEVGLQAMLTGRENSLLLGVLAGLSMAETRARMDEIAARAKLGDAFDRPIHTYSQGMRARLHLAAIQSVSAQVLLLDEVFEALDHEFRGIVEAYARELRERGGIVVAAGHDHVALERICPRALWLDGGRVRGEGSFAEVVPAYRGARPPEPD
jgi:ABC-type polysaccharide/polyol phosphate transport system ATPase subunit